MNQKSFILLFPVLLLVSVNASAQQYNAIGFDVLSPLIIKGFKFSYERSFHKHFSGAAYFETGKYESGTSGTYASQSEVYSIKGPGGTLEARYYPLNWKPAPYGLFIGGFFRYYSLTEKYTGESVNSGFPFGQNKNTSLIISTSGHAVNVGLAVGYKWIWGHFFIEPLTGFALSSVTWQTPNQRNQIDPFFKNEDIPVGTIRVEMRIGLVFPEFKKRS
jgi:hypothetical protein